MSGHGIDKQASAGSMASQDMEKQDISVSEDAKELEEVLSTYTADPEAERR